MTASDVWSIATAVISAVGGGALIVFALSSWLGKVWADRILESDKAKYQKEFAELKAELDKRLHAHNVAATRLDTQRVDAIRDLFGALIVWHDAVVQVVAPNNLNLRSHMQAIDQYKEWSTVLHEKSKQLEAVAMRTAIYLSEETYQIIGRCGMSASMMSIEFKGAVYNNRVLNTPVHLANIEAARLTLNERYQSDYEPARIAVVTAFRQVIDPASAGKSIF